MDAESVRSGALIDETAKRAAFRDWLAARWTEVSTPVGPVPTRGAADLLTPVGPTPTRNVPDLLTPVGPTPTRGGIDLPAPKGFFDDIPQAKGPSPSSDPFGPQATDVIHPEDNARTRKAWEHSVLTGEEYRIEHRMRRADGMFVAGGETGVAFAVAVGRDPAHQLADRLAHSLGSPFGGVAGAVHQHIFTAR